MNTRISAYLELTKPRLLIMVMASVSVASYVACEGNIPQALMETFCYMMLGTVLVAASSSVLNHYLERKTDALMPRTANRPLPSKTLQEWEVLVFGAITIIVGFIVLYMKTNPLTAYLGLATWVSYVWIYTPLKYLTSWNTAVGAVSGALPLLMGWCGMGQPFDPMALSVFGLMFFWQFPHFMAIAWLYKTQYTNAGMKMLPVVEKDGLLTGMQAVVCAVAVIIVSLLPVWRYGVGASWFYLTVCLLFGFLQLKYALDFAQNRNDVTARRLLRSSLIYLPFWMIGLLTINYTPIT
ncbi:MAG: heme o synthase [Pirellulaceae bacterium]|nr:heme o synthase [Pirellulaceae bacterium]